MVEVLETKMKEFNKFFDNMKEKYPLYQDKDGYNIGNFGALKVGWEEALLWAEDMLSESQSLGEAFSKIVEELESEYDEKIQNGGDKG